MSAARKHVWMPSASLVAVLLLGVYYLTVFQPLARRARLADKPVVAEWDRFVSSNRTSLACAGVPVDDYANRLQQLHLAATNLATAEQLVRRRIQLPPPVKAAMSGAFYLIDLQNERQRLTEQMLSLAKQRGVAVEAAAPRGLAVDADYSVDMPNPALLWARLHFSNQLLLTAIECKVTGLRALTQLPDLNYRSAVDGTPFLEELPMRLELSGPTEAVNRFLTALPLPVPALGTVGLGATLTNKPVFFLHQVLIRKFAPDHPNDVLVEANVSGFVPVSETGAGAPGPTESGL